MRVVLTAGHDRALHVVAVAELLRRRGHAVAAVLVVSPFRVSRVKALVRQRGRGFLRQAARKLAGRAAAPSGGRDALAELLAREGVAERSLRRWAGAHGVPYHVVPDLDAPAAVRAVSGADGVIYGGGGILRRPFLEAARGRVLNAHAGPLPRVRGMNACEWTLLLGLSPAVTIHVIDAGIDTGGVVETIPLPVCPGDGVESLRSRAVALGVEGLVRAAPVLLGPLPPPCPVAAPERQCFVMAPVLRDLLEARLRAGRGAGTP
ncbi:MAG TPA: formyltransferase family protein [Longimicrobium sp.]|nr:formyltransferase family protein [Longimicrobium sp.]